MQTIFERTEKKYILSKEQANAFQKAISPYIEPDEYDVYSIYNLYYDTKHFDLIRNSLDKPPYKEKLRLRCYEFLTEESTIFVELKKKYAQTVFKRRVTCSYQEAMDLINHKIPLHNQQQITKEILYFLKFYQPSPKLFLAYDRSAFHGIENTSLRITFDRNIRYRSDHLSLVDNEKNHLYFQEHEVLVEIKVMDAFPLWLSSILSAMQMYSTSFSKYGKIYTNHIFHLKREEIIHV